MKKIFLLLTLFLVSFLFLLILPSKTLAACTTDPGLTYQTKSEGATSITYTIKVTNRCSGTQSYYLSSPSLPSGWTYLYSFTGSNCSVNTRCTISIAGGSSRTVTLKITRPTGETPGSYTVYARAALTSDPTNVRTTIQLPTYIVCANCDDKGYQCGSFTNNCGVKVSCGGCTNATCNSSHQCVAWKWACNNSTFTCSQTSTGTYASSASCEDACKPTPNCNSGISNCGTCNAITGACGNGKQTCQYTTLAGGGTCNPVSFTRNCEAECPVGQNCNSSNQCITPLPLCDVENCGGCNAITGACGPGRKTCTYTTRADGRACQPKAEVTYSCTAKCTDPLTCEDNQCVAPPPPPCAVGILSAFAPSGVPTGGICMLNRIIVLSLNSLLLAAIILALLFTIWGAFDWITSQGEKQALERARHKILFAIIGLMIAFLAFLIINVLKKFFGVTG